MRSLRPRGGLWGHADFLKLWAGQSISEFGSQISQLAIPWLAAVGLGDHGSPLDGDGVHAVPRLDHPAAPDLDDDRLHAANRNRLCEWSAHPVWSGYVDHSAGPGRTGL